MGILKRLFGKKDQDRPRSESVDQPVILSKPHQVVHPPTPAESTDERHAACPYCDARLDQRPTGQTNCPHCGQPIYVRRGQLLTEEEAQIQSWLTRLGYFGVGRETFDEHRQQLSDELGVQAGVTDTIWRVLYALAGTVSEHKQEQIYHELASLSVREKRDPTPYLRQANTIHLTRLKREGVKTVTTLTASDGHVCPDCRALAGTRMPIEEALASLPVPNNCQSPSGCRCCYVSTER
jgi:hypothetical protein